MLNDGWFYATHRLLHSPWLFKHVHSVHHRSIDVNPFSVYSFHPLEGVLLTAWVIPVVLLFPIPIPMPLTSQGGSCDCTTHVVVHEVDEFGELMRVDASVRDVDEGEFVRRPRADLEAHRDDLVRWFHRSRKQHEEEVGHETRLGAGQFAPLEICS